MRAPLPLHYNNSSLRKSAAAACLLTLRPLAELLHSPYFPDPQLPHVSSSPCENVNKQCFYYSHSWKFQDTPHPYRGPSLFPVCGVLALGVIEQRCGQSGLSRRMLK